MEHDSAEIAKESSDRKSELDRQPVRLASHKMADDHTRRGSKDDRTKIAAVTEADSEGVTSSTQGKTEQNCKN